MKTENKSNRPQYASRYDPFVSLPPFHGNTVLKFKRAGSLV